MKRNIFSLWPLSFLTLTLAGMVVILFAQPGLAQPDSRWLAHDRTRPQPPVVDAGTGSTQTRAGRPPSDATVLFDGKDLSAWVSMDGSPTHWIVKDDYMECTPGSGYIRTLQNFGDCQLHVEWATPVPAKGEGQGRGNSGVFFGLGQYEVQVLDSFKNRTYCDGSAGAVYGQYPPLVNASRPPGQWQSYDIIWTAPRFDATGRLQSPARITALHNGVLIQNNVILTGPTGWLQRAPYKAHPVKLPIALQDHGNPVRFRNVWVRELGAPSRPEFTFAPAVLDACVGTYEVRPELQVQITRDENQLVAEISDVRYVLFAESKNRFFAKTTDVIIDFKRDAAGQAKELVLSVGEGALAARKIK